jgi:glycosidase
LNLIGSHDAPRVISLARGDAASLRLATFLQMTMPGAPCIYYGDEIALAGASDYDGSHHDYEVRRTFPWQDRDVWDMDLLAACREFVALRHAHPVLRRGQYRTVFAQGRCYAFLRWNEQTRLVVVVNAEDHAVESELVLEECLSAGTVPTPIYGQGTADMAAAGRMLVRVPGRAAAVFAI